MKRVNILCTNLYAHGKVKRNCTKACKSEAKLN